jgi:hypothetical protein
MMIFPQFAAICRISPQNTAIRQKTLQFAAKRHNLL